MNTMLENLPWQQILAVTVVYLMSLVFYRLILHPLAHFPGPKLAAATLWYECYYDVFLDGQYTFQIARLHRKYGTFLSHLSAI